jgi:hypothetical protein
MPLPFLSPWRAPRAVTGIAARDPRAAARAAAALVLAAGGARAAAQPPAAPPAALDPTWLGATAGSEAENYLRAAQVAGVVPLGSLSIRPLGPAELRALTATLAPDGSQPQRGRALGRHAAALPASATASYTANYPWTVTQGPVWEGRGATAALRAGAAARIGPLTAVLQPVAFWSENRAFALSATDFGSDPAGRFGDYVLASQVDRPQRFGDDRYARLDPGNSSIRLDVGPVAVGASTSMQGWGPAVGNPLILGYSAGGFRHLFVGTSRPTSIWLGRLHLRSEMGRLDESPVFVGRRGRLATAVVAVFTPRGCPDSSWAARASTTCSRRRSGSRCASSRGRTRGRSSTCSGRTIRAAATPRSRTRISSRRRSPRGRSRRPGCARTPSSSATTTRSTSAT